MFLINHWMILLMMHYHFFKKYLPESKVETTDIGFDIVCDNIELGSYGIRSCQFLDWIYGTGCAIIN